MRQHHPIIINLANIIWIPNHERERRLPFIIWSILKSNALTTSVQKRPLCEISYILYTSIHRVTETVWHAKRMGYVFRAFVCEHSCRELSQHTIHPPPASKRLSGCALRLHIASRAWSHKPATLLLCHTHNTTHRLCRVAAITLL